MEQRGDEGHRPLGMVAGDPVADGLEVALGFGRGLDDHLVIIARYLRSSRPNTSSAGLVRPASASASPRTIEASSAASRASRSWTRRTPSRSTSLFEL